MTWSRRFRARERVRGSLWIIPLLGSVLGGLLGTLFSFAGDRLAFDYWEYSSSAASTILTSIVAATTALTGFVVTVTVLVVQTATGTLSPRYMRLWYRDGLLKATLAALLGTLTFSFSLLRRVSEQDVPQFGIALSGLLVSMSVLLFVVFFHRFIHRQRPVTVAAIVARVSLSAFAEIVRTADQPDVRWEQHRLREAPSVVVRANRAGVIQAIDPVGLRSHGRRAGPCLRRNRRPRRRAT
jgi:uncharacterized membrane protein